LFSLAVNEGYSDLYCFLFFVCLFCFVLFCFVFILFLFRLFLFFFTNYWWTDKITMCKCCLFRVVLGMLPYWHFVIMTDVNRNEYVPLFVVTNASSAFIQIILDFEMWLYLIKAELPLKYFLIKITKILFFCYFILLKSI
jgi:hypothetical protein